MWLGSRPSLPPACHGCCVEIWPLGLGLWVFIYEEDQDFKPQASSVPTAVSGYHAYSQALPTYSAELRPKSAL